MTRSKGMIRACDERRRYPVWRKGRRERERERQTDRETERERETEMERVKIKDQLNMF